MYNDKQLNMALMVAEKAHANQSYGDILPYMYHIKEVVNIAIETNMPNRVIVACALHDVLEDSDVTYNDLKKLFGEKISDIVYAVTDEMGKNRKERKYKTYAKIAANSDAVLVKLIDRIANFIFSLMTNSRMSKLYKDENDLFIKSIIVNYNGELFHLKKLMDILKSLSGNEEEKNKKE